MKKIAYSILLCSLLFCVSCTRKDYITASKDVVAEATVFTNGTLHRYDVVLATRQEGFYEGSNLYGLKSDGTFETLGSSNIDRIENFAQYSIFYSGRWLYSNQLVYFDGAQTKNIPLDSSLEWSKEYWYNVYYFCIHMDLMHVPLNMI